MNFFLKRKNIILILEECLYQKNKNMKQQPNCCYFNPKKNSQQQISKITVDD